MFEIGGAMRPTYDELEELFVVMLPIIRNFQRGECRHAFHSLTTLELLLLRIYGRDFDGCWTASLERAVDRVYHLEACEK